MATRRNMAPEHLLKGADRVRKRPGVILLRRIRVRTRAFFEILSNAIDEAREGYGTPINVRRYPTAFQVED